MNVGVALAVVAVLGPAGLAAAQAKELPRIAVTCVDTDGKPVAGAEVHVFQYKESPAATANYVASGPHLTDAKGIATTAVALDFDGGKFDRWLYARVPGKLVAAHRWLRVDDSPIVEPRLRLEPSRELRGVVKPPEGVAARSVRVRTLSLLVKNDTDVFGMPFPRNPDLEGLRNTLPAVFDAKVADDGAFVLRDLPPRPLVYLAAEGPGLAQAQWFNAVLPERRIPDLVEIAMAPEAIIEGAVTDAAGKPLAEAGVSLSIDRTGQTTGVRYKFETRTDAAGRFRIGGLPAGEFQLLATHPSGVVRPQLVTLAKAQHARDVQVQLERGVEVRGKVLALPGRTGVERVGIIAITDDERSWRLGWAMTDPQGHFVCRLPSGGARLYLGNVPQGYQQPDRRIDRLLRIDIQAGDASLTKLEFELTPK